MCFFKKQLLCIALIAVWPLGSVFASVITLDFSSGTYSAQETWSPGINLYEEDGFSVRTVDTLDAFYNSTSSALNWYDGLTEIIVESSSGYFDLNSLDIVTPAYSGLKFISSKGDVLTVGSISGELAFAGAGWESIESFTIAKIIDFDILMVLDNITVTTVAVTEPGTLALLALGLVGVGMVRRK